MYSNHRIAFRYLSVENYSIGKDKILLRKYKSDEIYFLRCKLSYYGLLPHVLKLFRNIFFLKNVRRCKIYYIFVSKSKKTTE